jgi:maltose-binding protein MalE
MAFITIKGKLYGPPQNIRGNFTFLYKDDVLTSQETWTSTTCYESGFNCYFYVTYFYSNSIIIRKRVIFLEARNGNVKEKYVTFYLATVGFILNIFRS